MTVRPAPFMVNGRYKAKPLIELALVRSLGSQVVYPVWRGLEIPTLDQAYKASNSFIHIYRHSGGTA